MCHTADFLWRECVFEVPLSIGLLLVLFSLAILERSARCKFDFAHQCRREQRFVLKAKVASPVS
eukprot:4460625-Amphidinium_carterae.1